MKVTDVSRRALVVSAASCVAACFAGVRSTLATGLAIPVASLPEGAVAANAFAPGFLSAEGTVFASSRWGAGAAKYLKATDYKSFIAKTAAASRDVEIRTWMRNGVAFARLTESGKAIYFGHNGETPSGTLEIGIAAGLTEGREYRQNGTFYGLYSNSNLAGTVPGYDRDHTAGDIFSFGVQGFDIYVKFNGSEIVRLQDYRHMEAGAVAIQANNNYGFRDVDVHPCPSPFTDISANVIDLRYFGLRSITIPGSIGAHSNQLTLAADAGLQIGDNIIVEVGGESGGGLRGTVGVGGTWPALSYAGAAEMHADTGQAPGTYAWLRESGDVHLWSPDWALNTWTDPDPNLYYTNRVAPKALVAAVTAVSLDRCTLTLDKSAVAASQNANVYLDNTNVFKRLLTGDNWFAPIEPANITVRIPWGTFAVSDVLRFFWGKWWIFEGGGKGQTAIFSPRGTRSASLSFYQCENIIARDFHLHGNARFNGYGIATSKGGSDFQGYPQGVTFDLSINCFASDLKITDVFFKAVGASSATDCDAYRCDCVLTDGLQRYIQWMFQWSDSTRGQVVDCTVTSPILTAGFETFRSTGVSFIRPIGINATCSANSSGSFLFEGAKIIIKAMSQYSTLSFSEHNPIININTNIQPPDASTSLGGTIRNPTIIQEGYVNANNDSLIAIVVNQDNPNITIEAIPPWTLRPMCSPLAGGYIEAPDYKSPSLMRGGEAVNSTGRNTIIRGIRAAGAGVPFWGNLTIRSSDGSGSITNCVADSIITNAATSGNKTNTAWAASP